jgi:putative ABC transport system permease protein
MWMEDLRSAVRTLRSASGFALTAILSLSVGIGGTVSMFTVVNSILLKPLAFRAPGKLVRVLNRHTAAASGNDQESGLLAREFIRWRKQVKTLDSFSVTALACRACTLTGTGRPERLGAMAVSAEYFDTLGVQAQLGRWFRESEEQSGRPGVVILSNAFWRRNFAASADILGQYIHINGAP